MGNYAQGGGQGGAPSEQYGKAYDIAGKNNGDY